MKCCRLDRLMQRCCHPLFKFRIVALVFIYLLLLLFYLDHFILRNKFCYLSSLSCILPFTSHITMFYTVYSVCIRCMDTHCSFCSWILVVHVINSHVHVMCYKHSKHIYCKNSVYFLKYLLTF